MSQQAYAGTVKVDESIVVKKYTDASWDLGVAFETTIIEKIIEAITARPYTDESWGLGIAFEKTVVAISESVS